MWPKQLSKPKQPSSFEAMSIRMDVVFMLDVFRPYNMVGNID